MKKEFVDLCNNPEKIFANAKARIAETAGCTVRDVEHMIKQYTKMKQQMAMKC